MPLLEAAKSALSVSAVFQTYQRLVGAPACHRRFIDSYVQPRAGDRVVDLGCGTGASLEHLPSTVGYVGVDVSQAYIDTARARFDRGTFLCSDILTVDLSAYPPFDLAISFGVLHHLDERAARGLVAVARRVVRPGGYLVTIDPCRVAGQPLVARMLIENDRGRYIRNPDDHARLFGGDGHVKTTVLSDMLRIPYSMIVAQLRVG
jgi:SAM-dependent methyltransferase